MDIQHSKILLVGAGKMGGALLSGWLKAGIKPESVTVVETDAAQAKKLAADKINVVQSVADVKDPPDCIVLAVKPQSMDTVLASSRRKPGSQATPLYLSIAAGKTLSYFEKHLGKETPVVRAMPNTPALIGKAISAVVANAHVSAKQKALAESLLAAVGEVVWLENESLMDAVTAISGSGPAYVFLFIEALIDAGKKQGLPEGIAVKLALHTLRGSVKLAMKSGEPLATLRKNVTSPGGTTEAALSVLMKKEGLEALLNEAVAAAVKGSKELA